MAHHIVIACQLIDVCPASASGRLFPISTPLNAYLIAGPIRTVVVDSILHETINHFTLSLLFRIIHIESAYNSSITLAVKHANLKNIS